MTMYLLLPFVQALFSAVLVAIVLKGHWRSFTHRLFAFFLLGLAIWGIIIFGMRASSTVEQAHSWEKLVLILGPFVPVLFYHFSVRYTATRINRGLLPILYAICLLFIPLVATDLVVSGMEIRPFGYAPIGGPAQPLWVLFVYTVWIMALLNFIREWRTSFDAEQRNRVAYVITGMGFELVGGAFDLLPAYGLPLYPGLIIGHIAFCLVTTVAILRHSLLDIHVVLRRGVAYILTSALIAVPFVGVFLLLTNLFTQGGAPFWIYLVLFLVLALVLPQLWKTVQQRVDRWFYRDRYDYLRALENFSWQAQSLTDGTKLDHTMVNLIAGALRTSAVSLWQPLPGSSHFAPVCSAGMTKPPTDILLKSKSPLLQWLESSSGMLYYRDLDLIPQLQGLIYEEKENLQQVRAELVVPLKTRSGQLLGMLVLGQKLSEQPYTIEDKQLIGVISSQMAAIFESVRLYRDALLVRENLETWLNSMSDCVIIVGTDYTVEFTNKAAAEHFGRRSGRTCWEILGNDRRCSNCPMQHYLGNSTRGRHYTRTLTDREYDVAVAPLLNPNGSVSIIEVLRDMTERKHAEEREKQLQEELNRSSRLASIGELAAGVAHEINNPLTGILGFSERLLKKSASDEVNRDLERIRNEAQRAARVIQNLLFFARRREPSREYHNINSVLQKALELRAYELKTSNIEVVTNLSPNLPEVMVDFHQIQEVFLNIILNAEQAMTEVNHARKLSLQTQKMKGYLRISFADNGTGISAEHIDKLFDPFFTTRGERGGTGLGLSICHGILGQHGGKIYVKSKPGKGTTFFVELPLATKGGREKSRKG